MLQKTGAGRRRLGELLARCSRANELNAVAWLNEIGGAESDEKSQRRNTSK
jgi:hypothetical protein